MFFLNKTRRRVIFWLAVGFFIVIAPLVIAYSQGLRFDFATREIVRVGAIALDSEPDKARIVFNGELYNDDTPSVIRGLLPSHLFHVRIEEDGYFSWEKTLTVDAQKITSARGIRLFPVELEFESIATGTPNITAHFPSQRSDSFLLVGDESAFIYSVEEATSTPLDFPDAQRTIEIGNVEWHQDGSHVLFSRRTPNDLLWYVWDIDQNTFINLNQQYRLLNQSETQSISAPGEFNATQVYFLRNGANRFLVSLEGKLYILDTASSSFTDIGIDNVALLYGSGNRFFIVNAESTLLEIDSNGNIVRSYSTLGFIPERMSLSPNGQRLFYDSNGRGEIVWLQKQELDWHRDIGDIDVIFQEAAPPNSVWWHASSGYIVSYFSNTELQELVVYEIDIRDAQNSYRWDVSSYDSLSYIQQGSRISVSQGAYLLEMPEEF